MEHPSEAAEWIVTHMLKLAAGDHAQAADFIMTLPPDWIRERALALLAKRAAYGQPSNDNAAGRGSTPDPAAC